MACIREKYYHGGFRLSEKELQILDKAIRSASAEIQETAHILDYTVSFIDGSSVKVNDAQAVIDAGTTCKTNRICSVRVTAHEANQDGRERKLTWFIFMEFRECPFTARRNSATYKSSHESDDARSTQWVARTAKTMDERFGHIVKGGRSALFADVWKCPHGLVLATMLAFFPAMFLGLREKQNAADILKQAIASGAVTTLEQGLRLLESATVRVNRFWEYAPDAVIAFVPFAALVIVPVLLACWFPRHEFLWGDQVARFARIRWYRNLVATTLFSGVGVSLCSSWLWMKMMH
jgi:hypothetical protein